MLNSVMIRPNSTGVMFRSVMIADADSEKTMRSR
jgi:hypothetical protein